MDKIKKYLQYSYLAVIGYLPFHALITTTVINQIGAELYIKGIKDAFIFTLFILIFVYVILNQKKIVFKQHYIFSTFIVLFIVTVLLLALFNKGTNTQLISGMILFFRPLWMLFVGVLLVGLLSQSNYKDNLIRLTILCSFIVVAFGFLQVFLLPKDFLSIFGYSEATIKPYQTIDNNESFIRILSTLRGPNPLGAYLALLAPLAVYYFKKIRTRRNIIALIYGVFFLSTLYGSQSRSAWIGLVAGLATYVFLSFKNKKILAFITCAILPLISLGYIFRNSYFIQNTIFHRDPNESSAVDSDDQRIASLKYAIDRINEKPFGHGVGASGPASNYGPKPVIIENYYLDMAYQIGWFGMLLFLGLITSVGYSLLKQKTDLSNAVFSGLVAISVIALFWPVWTDETVALTWWGLAGLVLSSDIVQKVKKR